MQFEIKKNEKDLLKKEIFWFFSKKRIIILGLICLFLMIISTCFYTISHELFILVEINASIILIIIISLIIAYARFRKLIDILIGKTGKEPIVFVINELDDCSFQYKISNDMFDVVIKKKEIAKVSLTKTFILVFLINGRYFFFLKNSEILKFFTDKGII